MSWGVRNDTEIGAYASWQSLYIHIHIQIVELWKSLGWRRPWAGLALGFWCAQRQPLTDYQLSKVKALEYKYHNKISK